MSAQKRSRTVTPGFVRDVSTYRVREIVVGRTRGKGGGFFVVRSDFNASVRRTKSLFGTVHARLIGVCGNRGCLRR